MNKKLSFALLTLTLLYHGNSISEIPRWRAFNDDENNAPHPNELIEDLEEDDEFDEIELLYASGDVNFTLYHHEGEGAYTRLFELQHADGLLMRGEFFLRNWGFSGDARAIGRFINFPDNPEATRAIAGLIEGQGSIYIRADEEAHTISFGRRIEDHQYTIPDIVQSLPMLTRSALECLEALREIVERHYPEIFEGEEQ